MMKLLFVCLLAFVCLTSATVYFREDFDDSWTERWTKSEFKGAEAGLLTREGKKVVKTSQDAKFYQYSAPFPEFSNKGKTLVFQFNVRHAQGIDCGGGYFKLLPAGFDGASFNGDTPYNVMFGPDMCGATRRVHAIAHYKGENFLIKEEIPATYDKYTHSYTWIIEPDQSYRVLIDNKEVRSGNLAEDWDFLGPKEIKDPEASKPEDWVDEAEIDDPEDVKPEGWDDVPAQIADPDAKKPEDWDDDLDGEWEAPTIDNPEYKGAWKPKKIPNPAYKGPWVHPMIPNPDYAEDDSIYEFSSIAGIGLEIWQVKSGTIFSGIIVTDDPAEAEKLAEDALDAQTAEKEIEEKKQAEEAEKRKKEAEERAAKEAAEKAAKEADSEQAEEEEEEAAADHDEL